MSVFDIDISGQRQQEREAQVNGLNQDSVEPGFWDNVGQGIGNGIMRGGARTAQFVAMAGATVPIALDAAMGDTQLQDWYFKNVIDDTTQNAVDHWTPAANEVGTAGRVLGGLSEIVLPLAAGAGNPTLMMGSQAFGAGTDLVRQGVDGDTASQVAMIEAAASGVGFLIPFFGKTLGQRVASGVAGNLAVNPVASFAQQQVLEAGGYQDQAQAFDPMNLEARAIDVLTGAVFGAVSHVSARRFSRVEIDSAATANNSKHLQFDTLPGKPDDVAAIISHQNAMEDALRQLSEGDQVTVRPMVAEAGFKPAPPGDLKPMAQAFRDVFGTDIPEPAPLRLEPEPLRLETIDTNSNPPLLTDAVDSPEVQAARSAVVNKPDMQIIDDDGMQHSARDFLKSADDEVQRANTDARAYSAAVACFLRFGL